MNTNALISKDLNKILNIYFVGKKISFGDSTQQYKVYSCNAVAEEITISTESGSFSLKLADLRRIKIIGEEKATMDYLTALKKWEWKNNKDNLRNFFEDERIKQYLKNYKDEEIEIDRRTLEKIGFRWNRLMLERVGVRENRSKYFCSKEKLILFIISELIKQYQVTGNAKNTYSSHELFTWFKISGRRDFVKYFEQIFIEEKPLKYKNILIFLFVPIFATHTKSSLLVSFLILGCPFACIKLVLKYYDFLHSNIAIPYIALENWGPTNWILLTLVIYLFALLKMRVKSFCKKIGTVKHLV